MLNGRTVDRRFSAGLQFRGKTHGVPARFRHRDVSSHFLCAHGYLPEHPVRYRASVRAFPGMICIRA